MFFWNSCFFHNPVNVGNLVFGSSAFSKTSLNIWKFTVHVLLKPCLENFEHYFTSVWDFWLQFSALQPLLNPICNKDFRAGSVVKDPPANAGDIKYMGLIPGLGRSPGVGNGTPLQFSCHENPVPEEPNRLQSMGSQRVRHDWVSALSSKPSSFLILFWIEKIFLVFPVFSNVV